MKKRYLFIAMGIIVLTFSVNAQLTIPKILGTPVIDGVAEAFWESIPPVYVDVKDASNPAVPSINEGWFKMGWTDESLVILMRRDDDDFAPQWVTGLPDWQSDRDEIFINVDVDNLSDTIGASDQQGAHNGATYGRYQFTSKWVANGDAINPNYAGTVTDQWYHNAAYDMGYVVDGDEYYIEYEIPFSSLKIDTAVRSGADPVFMGGADVVFGLAITISDVDMADNPANEDARKILKWPADISAWETMEDGGTVTMGSDVVSGLAKLEQNGAIKVYPSPASDFISIKGLETYASIRIIDMLGNVVLQHVHVSNGVQIDVSSLIKGIYFVQVDSYAVTKLVIE